MPGAPEKETARMAGPENDPEEPLYSGEPLETAEGTRVPRQQPAGPESEGGGEFPDPDTPARLPAPGAADAESEDDTGS
jgi:hypothetical protein